MNFEESSSHHPPERRPGQRPKLSPNPKATLREQVHEVMRFLHYSERTEEAYWQWIVRFLRFHRGHPHLTPAKETDSTPHPNPLPVRGGEGAGAEREKRWRHPREMGAAEVGEFLTHLASELQVAAATQNQALR